MGIHLVMEVQEDTGPVKKEIDLITSFDGKVWWSYCIEDQAFGIATLTKELSYEE